MAKSSGAMPSVARRAARSLSLRRWAKVSSAAQFGHTETFSAGQPLFSFQPSPTKRLTASS